MTRRLICWRAYNEPASKTRSFKATLLMSTTFLPARYSQPSLVRVHGRTLAIPSLIIVNQISTRLTSPSTAVLQAGGQCLPVPCRRRGFPKSMCSMRWGEHQSICIIISLSALSLRRSSEKIMGSDLVQVGIVARVQACASSPICKQMHSQPGNLTVEAHIAQAY